MDKINNKITIKLVGLIIVTIGMLTSISVSASAVNDYIINNKVKPADETLSLGRIYNQDSSKNGGIKMDYTDGKPKMVIIHEVGVDGGSINGSIDYMVRTQDNAFVHSFVDGSQLITIADKAKKSWGSGGWGNQYGIQIEQMRVNTSAAFYKEIATLAKWTADQMIKYGMGAPKLMSSPSSPQKNDLSSKPDGNLASHKMISYKFNQTTDHVDPDEYWSRFGYDMNQFRDLVDYYYSSSSLNLSGMTWQKLTSDNSEINFGITYQSKSKVTFNWQYYDISQKTWTTFAGNTGSNWVTFKAPHPGQYLIYVKATNAEGESRDYNIGWNVDEPLKLSGMTWQKLTADNGEANIGVSYQSKSKVTFDWMYYDLSNKTWSSIATKTGSNWVTFKAPHADQYLIYVKATNAEGTTQDYSIGWNVDESVSLSGMTWRKITPDNSEVDFGIAYRANSQTTFTWQYYDISNKKWTVIVANTPSNWITVKLPKAGQYLIYVEAKTSSGNTANFSIGWNTLFNLNNLTGTNDTQKAWFNALYQDAQKLAKDNDLFPSIMLSQAIAESAWGQSELATKANNLFGIKADAGWKGDKYTALTNEVVNGQTVQVMADFRKYSSQAESLKDYVTKIKTTKNGSAYRYQAAWRSNAKTYQNAAQALKDGGYATDPNYPTNLINRIVNYRLDTLD